MDFIKKVRDITLAEGDQLVSFDVVSLFTSVPRPEAMQELRRRLDQDTQLLDRTMLSIDKIMELINLCLDNTYFQLGDNFYEQRQGLAMGSPLSPILADLYMEWLEAKVKVQDKEGHIKMWKRYVDDVFAIIAKEGDPQSILDQANTLSETVKFTLEVEKEGTLPFLDVELIKNKNRIDTKVYRKATDSGRYLHYTSNHPRSVKVGVAACLLRRAETHCGTAIEKKREKKEVITTLKRNGYPQSVFSELERKKEREKDTTRKKKEEYKNVVTIPYIAGLSEAIRREGEKVGLKTVFAAKDTLKKRLTHLKPKGEGKDKNLVYKIPCHCGANYVGETGRQLQVRVNEHRRNWEKMKRDKEEEKDTENISSLLAIHAVEKEHQIKWEEVKILASEVNMKKRKIHEAAAIYLEEEVISQPSFEIPRIWRPVIREERKEIVRERKPRRSFVGSKEPLVNTQHNRKRRREGEEEGEHGGGERKITRIQEAPKPTVVRQQPTRHLYNLRRARRRPSRLIEQ